MRREEEGPAQLTKETADGLGADAAARPVSVPTLRLLYSGAAGVVSTPEVALHRAVTTVGRSGQADIALPSDARASRIHASVLRDLSSGALCVVDADSRNGVVVNGQRTKQAPLRDGDLLRIGDSLLLVRFAPPRAEDPPVPGLLGCSPHARALRAEIRRVAPAMVNVLLLGESGTGKEIVARALHEASGRRGAFVALNCAAIPESLAESQLFGHAARAFTGATAQPGVFRAAHGGTLLLDEVGELPPSLQPKLLRVLEDHTVVPLGETAPIACDVRVIAATNRDLSRAVESGSFRGDLHARLLEYVLRLPPLRDRREDVLLILRDALGAPSLPLTARLAEALVLHPWPYNVREVVRLARQLRLAVEPGTTLDLEHVAERLSVAAPAAPDGGRKAPLVDEQPPRARTDQPSLDTILAALREHKGVITEVARALGRSRRQVHRWLQQHGIDPNQYRG